MKNFIALIFIFVLGMQMAFAETLPPKGYYDVKPEDYPILFEYMNNYAKQLFEEFNPGILWANHGGGVGTYTINKDGTISDIPDYLDDHVCTRYLKKLILKTTPPPFPEELEADKIKIDLALFRTDFTEIKVNYWAFEDKGYIRLYKDHQWKFWFKKKK